MKANIKTINGMKITIEGSPSEVSEVIEDLRDKKERNKEPLYCWENGERITITSVLIKFIKEGFFDKQKKFREISHHIEKANIFVPSTTLHPVLFRLVASGKLKRERGKNYLWEYAKK